MKTLYYLLVSLLVTTAANAQTDTSQQIITDRVNSAVQQDKPYVILISADGFRHDYAKLYPTPTLDSLVGGGVRAQAMIPSFPSKTFPNHYTLVTGMYPAHHGLVDNRFYDARRNAFYTVSDRTKVEDGSWYGGLPLWVLAEQQHMLTASFYWVGSEADIQGVRPTYYYRYNEAISIERRIQTVVDWLRLPAERRPHLITFYFPEIDLAGHRHGPESDETRAAVQYVDRSLAQLTRAVAATGLPVNFIFVSDHGMTPIDTVQTIPYPAIDTADFVLVPGSIMLQLHAKNKKAVWPTYRQLKRAEDGYRVYRRSRMPARLHYDEENDTFGRLGDLILLADHPRVFHSGSRPPNPGDHGFDPAIVRDMYTVFYAWGPALPSGKVIPTFENVHLYPLVAQLLGLTYSHPIDGKPVLVEQLLGGE